MRISSSVDLPNQLLAARRKGGLVVFAGAGVSTPEPSHLPDFKKLVQRISRGALKRDKGEPFDHFLGRLQELNVPVHERAATILNDPTSHPNDLHSLLVELFDSSERIRIVTTNFDTHFESPIKQRWPSSGVRVYSGPALPVGDSFSGLAYIHGRLGGDPKELVLTDRDFGRAYLTQGWARRFLEKLFTTYDVLFVGYSHQDTVLNYLARGLPPTTDRVRYALTPSGDPKRWTFLGITPIEYDPADQHLELKNALVSWVDLEGRGPLGHERKVQQLVASTPDALPEQDEDYLLFCLDDPILVQFFFRHAKGKDWLSWVYEHSRLSPIFDPGNTSQEVYELSAWFTFDPLSARGGAARDILNRHSRSISPILWGQIAHKVWRALDKDSKTTDEVQHAAEWLTILQSRGIDASVNGLIVNYWIDTLSTHEHTDLAVCLFTYLTRPFGAAEAYPSFSRTSIRVHGDQNWLPKSWIGFFKPNLRIFARHLAPVVLAHIQQAHLILRSQGEAANGDDPLSFGRPAIEAHPQNEHRDKNPFYVLVDAGRDILEWLGREEPRLAEALIHVWLDIETPLIRRIAIYALALHPKISAGRKLKQIIDGRWLEQPLLHHEVFLLLKEVYPKSAKHLRRQLIRSAEDIYTRRAEENSDSPDQMRRRSAYHFYQFLEWLKAADPACVLVKQRLEEIQQRHPDFQVDDHPDFPGWSYGIHSLQFTSPLSANEILRLNPEEWIQQLEKIKLEERDPISFEDPVRGFLYKTEEVAGQYFDWGMHLASHLASKGNWSHVVWDHLLRSWSGKPLGEPEWHRLLILVSEPPTILRHTKEIAELFLRRMENREVPATTIMVTQTWHIAEAIWAGVHEASGMDNGQARNWAQLDTTGGKIGLFIVHALSRYKSIMTEEWEGIPELFQPLLYSALEAGAESSPFGRVMLCSQIHFFFAIDADWTRRHVFPLFDWSRDPVVAQQAWHGLLAQGRAQRDLAKELMPLIRQTFNHLKDLTGLRKQFPQRLAWIAYRAKRSPLESGWLKDFLRKAEPADLKEWAETLQSILRDSDPGERLRLWDSWLRSYFDYRLEFEVPIEEDEWKSMIGWSLYLGDVLPELVKLLERKPAIRKDDTLYYQILHREDLFQSPDALADLLTYLLSAEQRLLYNCKYVEEILKKLAKRAAKPEKLRALIDRYAALGCENAQELADLIDKGAL